MTGGHCLQAIRQAGGRLFDHRTLDLVTAKERAFAICPPSLPQPELTKLMKQNTDFRLGKASYDVSLYYCMTMTLGRLKATQRQNLLVHLAEGMLAGEQVIAKRKAMVLAFYGHENTCGVCHDMPLVWPVWNVSHGPLR